MLPLYKKFHCGWKISWVFLFLNTVRNINIIFLLGRQGCSCGLGNKTVYVSWKPAAWGQAAAWRGRPACCEVLLKLSLRWSPSWAHGNERGSRLNILNAGRPLEVPCRADYCWVFFHSIATSSLIWHHLLFYWVLSFHILKVENV